MNNKYKIIYADPPWKYNSKSAVNNSSGSQIKKLNEHYESMNTKDLKSLPVIDIIDKEACCFMWVTDSHLKEGIEIMESWGFKYKTIAFVWLKKTKHGNNCVNVAPWTLKSTEICLFGTKGAMTKYKKHNSVMQFVEAERADHSKKPQEVRLRIEKLFGDLPRIELFARDKKKGWEALGNDIDNKDIRESIDLIIQKNNYGQRNIRRRIRQNSKKNKTKLG